MKLPAQGKSVAFLICCLAVLVAAPLLSTKGQWISLLCRVGILSIFALSFNLLLGETGLLSFGHAVYFGLGAFSTMHLLRAIHQSNSSFPITLLPLVGGAVGLFFGLCLGYVITRRAGTTFAMISLGIGELVAAGSHMFPAIFGGEGGISSNRMTPPGWFGITYGTPLQLYYLIAGWAFVCALAMYLFTDTPLGRLANAVRDNPERAEFVGYNPQRVRHLMVALAGFFAGVAGGLNALNYEIVTAETLGAATSGLVLMMVFVGGLGSFVGPILGAALITVLQTWVSAITEAWPFYFGLFFTILVVQSPGGIAGMLKQQKALYQAGQLGRAIPHYLLAALPMALLAWGLITLVEMSYALSTTTERGNALLHLFGLTLNAARPLSWIFAAAAASVGWIALKLLSRWAAGREPEAPAALQPRQT